MLVSVIEVKALQSARCERPCLIDSKKSPRGAWRRGREGPLSDVVILTTPLENSHNRDSGAGTAPLTSIPGDAHALHHLQFTEPSPGDHHSAISRSTSTKPQPDSEFHDSHPGRFVSREAATCLVTTG